MSVDLVADAGSASANAFVDVDAANDYLASRLNADAWTTATDDTKAAALIEATRDITLLEFLGSRVTTSQALAWPRMFAKDPDQPDIVFLGSIQNHYYYDQTIVPARIANATCELALEYLKAGTTDLAALDPQIGILREKVDVIETDYAKPYDRAQGLARFPRVIAILAPTLSAASVGGGLTVVRC